jgi:hypothetical protein
VGIFATPQGKLNDSFFECALSAKKIAKLISDCNQEKIADIYGLFAFINQLLLNESISWKALVTFHLSESAFDEASSIYNLSDQNISSEGLIDRYINFSSQFSFIGAYRGLFCSKDSKSVNGFSLKLQEKSLKNLLIVDSEQSLEKNNPILLSKSIIENGTVSNTLNKLNSSQPLLLHLNSININGCAFAFGMHVDLIYFDESLNSDSFSNHINEIYRFL